MANEKWIESYSEHKGKVAYWSFYCPYCLDIFMEGFKFCPFCSEKVDGDRDG